MLETMGLIFDVANSYAMEFGAGAVGSGVEVADVDDVGLWLWRMKR